MFKFIFKKFKELYFLYLFINKINKSKIVYLIY
jgi:hypothetical protein